MAHWRHINPLAIFEKLLSTDLVILEEKDNSIGISVGMKTLHQLWVRAWRVVGNLGAKSWSS